MTQNVAQELEKRSFSLMEKLASNLAVSNLLLGFLGRISVDAIKRGKPIEGIELGPINGTMGNFSFKVIYHPIAMGGSRMILPTTDFHRFVAGRAAKMAMVLEKNPRIVTGFTDLIEAIDRYCRGKGKPFSFYEIQKAMVTREDVCRIVQRKEGGRWSL